MKFLVKLLGLMLVPPAVCGAFSPEGKQNEDSEENTVCREDLLMLSKLELIDIIENGLEETVSLCEGGLSGAEIDASPSSRYTTVTVEPSHGDESLQER